MTFSSNFIRVRASFYIFLVIFYVVEILFEDYKIGDNTQTQFDLRQGFGYVLLSLSVAALGCVMARLDKSILVCDSALFAFTVGRILLVAFAGFNGEAVFLLINVLIVIFFPCFDCHARITDLRERSRYSSELTDKTNADEEDHIEEVPMKPFVVDESLFDGFRVRLDKLPESQIVNNNLPWSTFTHVEHRIDSSSCHIYTAMWADRPVILKLIKADRIASPVAVAEFETEAHVLSRIRHPHIVRFLGSGHDPRRFLVLELLDGGSLSHALGVRIDKDQRSWRRHLTYCDSLKLARAMASALEYLHTKWSEHFIIIHRDLKPDNIGFTSDGHIKLFDFGLCSVVRRKTSRDDTYEMTGNTGTLRYMAPEVALGKEYNQSVDTYSFGVILWQMVKGKVPFSGLGRRTYMENVVVGGERPKIDRRWPKQFSTLLQRCWSEDKSMRPSFSEIVTELDALILADETSTKNKIINILAAALLPSQEVMVHYRVYFISGATLFFLISIILCLAEHTEIFGIALTIVSAFLLYTVLIMCLQPTPRSKGQVVTSGGGGTGKFVELNPLHRGSGSTGESKKKGLHGVDYV